jgi:hypothetical protein
MYGLKSAIRSLLRLCDFWSGGLNVRLMLPCSKGNAVLPTSERHLKSIVGQDARMI